MVGIQGLGGIPEPKPERTAKAKNERDAAPGSGNAAGVSSAKGGSDAVDISSAAQAAAEVANLIQAATGQEDVRLDKVEAARQRLEQGDYKNPEVVAQVADKIMKFLG